MTPCRRLCGLPQQHPAGLKGGGCARCPHLQEDQAGEWEAREGAPQWRSRRKCAALPTCADTCASLLQAVTTRAVAQVDAAQKIDVSVGSGLDTSNLDMAKVRGLAAAAAVCGRACSKQQAMRCSKLQRSDWSGRVQQQGHGAAAPAAATAAAGRARPCSACCAPGSQGPSTPASRACLTSPCLACLPLLLTQTVLGIILGGGAGSRLYPLTKKRAKPAVPLGANYRLIDIPVSNCINSGARCACCAVSCCAALADAGGDGRCWQLQRRQVLHGCWKVLALHWRCCAGRHGLAWQQRWRWWHGRAAAAATSWAAAAATSWMLR